MDPFKRLEKLNSCDRADGDDPTGRAKGQQVERGDNDGERRWREALRGERGPRCRASGGRGASKEKMQTDGGGAVKGSGGELARSSVRELFNPSACPGMSVLFPPLQSSGAFPAGATSEGPAC